MSKLYYGNELVNKWYDGSDNINKAYYGDTLMFGNETQPFPNLCYGVTDDISTYTATTFDMVYDTTQEAWYMLNNLNQYEQYGIIENVDSLSNATHYNGKLVIYDSYEYEWGNGEWNNVGEVVIQQDIPIGYTQLEWINGNGGEILLDDVYAKSTLKSQLKLRYTTAGGSIFYGTSGTSDSSDYRLFKYSNSTYIDMQSERTSGSWLTSTTTDYEVEFGNFYLKNLQTGTNYGTGSTQSAFDYTGNNNYKLKVFNPSEQGRLYYLKIYDNNTLVRYFYPCYRNSDGVVGLYDVVTDKFYTSTGSVTSGDTSGGSIVIPKEYDEKSDPDNNLTFDTMEEAYAYDGCVYVGIVAMIDGIGYILNDEYEWELKPVLNYLQFTARNGSATIGMSGSSSPNVSYSWDGYSWTTWDYSNITIPNGETIYFKGDNPNGFNTNSPFKKKFTMSGTVEANGNVQSLLYDDDFEDNLTIPSFYCFFNLFQGCSGLTSAPQLPATTLTSDCYENMFNGCTSLTSAPQLPATTLEAYCYQGMFQNCSGLTSAPQLPATTMKSYCYCKMFQNCTSLATAPVLPATTLESYCYQDMFHGCTSLTTAPTLNATTMKSSCYSNMFYGCTSLTSAPTLPATILANGCYYRMFYGCTSLTTAPTLNSTNVQSQCYCDMFRDCTSLVNAPSRLPATSLQSSCYNGMFYGCTSLTTAPQLPATTLAQSCYNAMFSNCTSLTSAPQLPATTLAQSCYNAMFSNCTSLTSAPQLPATTLAYSCYYAMFRGCTSLTTAPVLSSTTLAYSCYQEMFKGCTSLTTAPTILPATTLAEYCYSSMFQGCTSLTTAPELPAITLDNYCYREMFRDCSNLNYIKAMFTNTPSSTYTNWWVSGVAATGTFVKNANAPWDVSGDNGVPNGWTIEYESVVMPTNYLQLTAKNGAATITMSGSSSPSVYYSTDRYVWEKWSNFNTAISIPEDGTVYFKGNNPNGFSTSSGSYKVFRMSGNGTVKASGNIMSLLHGDEFEDKLTIPSNNCFFRLFSGCTSLTSVSEITMPAMTLKQDCYTSLFAGCTNLVDSPVLPAMSMQTGSYSRMFEGCTSLIHAPQLPMLSVGSYGYQHMFSGCTSLVTAPELPATSLNGYCYENMFSNCTSLVNAPTILPATSLQSSCYNAMFSGCTSLETAPELPAKTLTSGCYNKMFNGCTNLNYIKAMFTTAPTTSYTNDWVNGVAANGTFVKNTNATWTTTGVYGVPNGWTVEYETPN